MVGSATLAVIHICRVSVFVRFSTVYCNFY